MNKKLRNNIFWSRITAVFGVVIMVFAAHPTLLAQAATAGFSAPSSYSNSTLQNPANAYLSDNLYAQSNDSFSKSAVYGNFGFNIPAGSTINRVEVSVEGHGNKNWKVAVSKDNGISYSAFVTIPNTVNDAVTITSGPGTLWGLTGWNAVSLSNTNFKVRITPGGGSTSNVAYLDQLRVRVTYTPPLAASTMLVITPPVEGTYGGTVDLQATLTVASNGLPLSGKTISFILDGFSRGSAVTDANGVATLNGVTLTSGVSGALLNVGTYGVGANFAGDSSYAFADVSALQVVSPLNITVTADAKSKDYGSNDPLLTYSYAPALVGTDAFSGSLTRTVGENVGNYAINQGTLALSPNYAISFVSEIFSITPLAITVTADDKAAVAGDPDPIFTFSVSRFVGSDNFGVNPVCEVAEDHSTAGTYTINCSGGSAGPNYIVTYNSGILTVTDKHILVVTADAQTITYGSSDPDFTFTYSGFVDGDADITGTAPTCTVVGIHNNAGSYPSIVCSGGEDSKYEFSYVSGTLTVSPLSILLTADDQTKIYGASDPALTYLSDPEPVSGDSFVGVLMRVVGENVGTYDINQGTLTLGPNYTINFIGANLTINKAAITVTADDHSIGLGAADPLFSFIYEGFVNGEDASVIDTPPTCSIFEPHTGLGTYSIICSGGLDNNYSFSYVNGSLFVVSNEVNAYINSALMGTYSLAPIQSTNDSYPSILDGPVRVISTYSDKIFTTQVVASGGSYNELAGYPANSFTTEYWFPYYDHGYPNVSGDKMRTWILVGNPSSSQTATVEIRIGGVLKNDPANPANYFFNIPPGGNVTPRWIGLTGGPVQVKSTNGVDIFASERVFTVPYNSFNEVMGYPATQFTTEYWFPWYDTRYMNTYLLVGNTSTSQTATVEIYLGTTKYGPYDIDPNTTLTQYYPDMVIGPVRVVSTNGVNIVTSEFTLSGTQNSFNEVMGYPFNQFDVEYWFPWYDHGYPDVSGDNMRTWVLVGNPSNSQTANVQIYVNSVLQTVPGSNPPTTVFTIPPGANVTPRWPGTVAGPVQVVSDIPIFASERVFTVPTNAFNEFMGIPSSQLTTEYWFPWYDSINMSNKLLIGKP